MRARVLGGVAAGALIVAFAGVGTAQPPAPAPWATACSARLEQTRVELARTVPWAARASVGIQPTTWPGWFVHYASDDGRVSAMIETYATGPGPGWLPAGRGECFDESEPGPQLHEVRNYDGRQAQVEVTRAPRRQRALIGAALRAALDDCAAL